MRRIEPAFPDLLPVSHRLGPPPSAAFGSPAALDPVEMRLVWQAPARQRGVGDRTVPRRPVRVLVHAGCARQEHEFLGSLLQAGCGVLAMLDGALSLKGLPAPTLKGQVVVLVPWLPVFWGGQPLPDLKPWRKRGIAAGVLLCLGPSAKPFDQVNRGVDEAKEAGAAFVLPSPLSLPPEDRHRVYDRLAGEGGDEELENLLFHTDLGQLATELEREASRACRRVGLPEGLPGPATSITPRETFAAGAQLLIWARRLDSLDGVSSAGWQLRRAAQALLASRRDPHSLVAEDNLRVIPGFSPWVEAFARSAWAGSGEPFEEVLARWVAH
jgi:hypothetical protein